MINISKLVEEKTVIGNYFSPDAYVQGDVEFGLIENRSGNRLIALPETLLQGMYIGLEEELGIGSGVVLFTSGKWWGKNFYRRFAEELEAYYGKPLAEMEMIELLQCLKECWKTHGWGTLEVDVKYYQQGFLVCRIFNSPFVESAAKGKRPMGYLEAGVLSAIFSQLSGQDLHCVQTSCESMGAECNTFIIGLNDRLKPVSAWVEESHDHGTIMELLCRSQTV